MKAYSERRVRVESGIPVAAHQDVCFQTRKRSPEADIDRSGYFLLRAITGRQSSSSTINLSSEFGVHELDIQQLGAWGEFLGGAAGVIAALGVIATLLNLSRQLRQNTDQIRAQVAHDVMSALRDQSDAMKQSAEAAEVFRRGMRDSGALTDGERNQFNAINTGHFRVFEEAYLHHKAERLEQAYWDTMRRQLDVALQVPAVRDWWSTVDHFDPEFRKFTASLGTRSE